MSQKPILLWYRNDLRSHDHEPLNQALKTGAVVIPVYCFDSRWLQNTSFGFSKMGVFRAKFLLESVANLRQTLRDLGSDLIIRQGLPENVIAQLAITLNVSALYYHQEVTAEEKLVETELNKALSQHQISTQGFWGSTLYHPEDLPWAIAEIPEVFTSYRKPVEKSSRVRPTLPTPDALPPLPNSLNLDLGTLPSLEEWGLEHPRSDPRAVLFFRGGEKAGLQRIQDYIWQGNHLEHYKKTRNQTGR